jgi:plasmid maintenance system antidote protein VapI
MISTLSQRLTQWLVQNGNDYKALAEILHIEENEIRKGMHNNIWQIGVYVKLNAFLGISNQITKFFNNERETEIG